MEGLAVGESPRLAVRDIVDGDHGGDLTADGLGARRDRKELVQGTALVGLEVRKPHVA